MLITGLELKDIKSYECASFTFGEGVNGICGLNGHGKTTVVEAIGYALYNHLPYKKTEFTRHGKKNGLVVVRLEGEDGVEVEVRRRVSDGAPEIRLPHRALKGEDARHWLEENLFGQHGSFGEAPGFFQDMVGVPQGTFTAIFLETERHRKARFDRLLRVEDYERCHSELRGPASSVKERSQGIERSLLRVSTKLEEVPELEKALREKEVDGKQKEETLRAVGEELATLEGRFAELKRTKERMLSLEKELSSLAAASSQLKARMKKARKDMDDLAEARERMERTLKAYEGYEGLREERGRLEQERTAAVKAAGELAALRAGRDAAGKRMKELKDEVDDIDGRTGQMNSLNEEFGCLERMREEVSALKARSLALGAEVEELAGRKRDAGSGNVCPVFEGVTCTTVEDFEAYFKTEIGKRNVEKRGTDLRVRELEGEMKALAGVPGQLEKLKADIGRMKALRAALARAVEEREPADRRMRELEASGGAEAMRSVDERSAGLAKKEGELAVGHRDHLEAKGLARKLAGAQEELDAVGGEQRAAGEKQAGLKAGLDGLMAGFDPDRYAQTEKRVRELGERSSGLKASVGHVREEAERLRDRLGRLASLSREKERLEKEAEEEGGLLSFIEFVRTTLRETGEAVGLSFVEEISALAALTYGELMGDNSQTLRWDPGYALTVEDGQGRKDFRQLSGGEQMAAAIALRLALLRGLGGSDVIFLDEPTQNMDEGRRAELSRQILNIKGFRQIFVITHDDSFGAGYHNLIRVVKKRGKSEVVMDGWGRPGGVAVTEGGNG